MPITIDDILAAADEHHASDVFLLEGDVPRLKIEEQICLFGEDSISLGQMAALWSLCGADATHDRDKDSGLVSHLGTRFRVNLHRTMGRLGAVLRRIRTDIPPLHTLGVPMELLTRWAARSHGLILITGPTGMGKSTTMASLMQWMNETMTRHIVTIEDPIEYVLRSDRCVFTQREVGTDTNTFARGLLAAIRQAPDVIMIGEIRDYDTALTALQASETGNLVLASVHGERICDGLERFVNLFPPDNINLGLHMLSHQLVGVCCQKLVKKTDGGITLLVEHLENGGAVRDWIGKREVGKIETYLQRGADPNAVDFMRAIVAAYEAGIIDEPAAILASGDETEFRRAARGLSTR